MKLSLSQPVLDERKSQPCSRLVSQRLDQHETSPWPQSAPIVTTLRLIAVQVGLLGGVTDGVDGLAPFSQHE